MIVITFPDGKKKKYELGIKGIDIAKSISKSLASESIAIQVNNILLDLNLPINQDSKISIIKKSDTIGLDIIRHDTAHVLAEAVQKLYPNTKVSIGPIIEDGFYYDFDREKSFSIDDFAKIENEMKKIIRLNKEFVREIWNREDAINYFTKNGEKYKVELIQNFEKDEKIIIYKQGNWLDLCRGPHSPSTGFIGENFKLLKLAGAYWRGDSKNKMLQRIYGTAWCTKNDLTSYLKRLEEAEKRDHRKIGKQLNLFHLQDEATGSVFWHPNGWIIYRICEEYVRKKLNKASYKEVKTPSLIDRKLWEASGHWEKFRENMFITEGEDEKPMALKPMNCPAHVQIFNQGIKSYRDLPYRMSEFGSCHRNEPSGALHGIMRLRAFTQDDAHIFCTEDQINSETLNFCKLLTEIYNDFGFNKIKIRFADRPKIRAGKDDIWDKAERALQKAIDKVGLPYTKDPGEGAFYGPKLDFVLTDSIGREWQCGTLQVDFVLPESLDANYINEKGEKQRPVMLHRAILGSIERFIGVLIESTSGKFPLWLSPIQVLVTSITSEIDEYANEVFEALKDHNIRTNLDLRNEKINYKIREYSKNKIPIILVVGKNEMKDKSVSIRRFGSNDQQVQSLNKTIEDIKNESRIP